MFKNNQPSVEQSTNAYQRESEAFERVRQSAIQDSLKQLDRTTSTEVRITSHKTMETIAGVLGMIGLRGSAKY